MHVYREVENCRGNQQGLEGWLMETESTEKCEKMGDLITHMSSLGQTHHCP